VTHIFSGAQTKARMCIALISYVFCVQAGGLSVCNLMELPAVKLGVVALFPGTRA